MPSSGVELASIIIAAAGTVGIIVIIPAAVVKFAVLPDESWGVVIGCQLISMGVVRFIGEIIQTASTVFKKVDDLPNRVNTTNNERQGTTQTIKCEPQEEDIPTTNNDPQEEDIPTTNNEPQEYTEITSEVINNEFIWK